ncbi:MAG: CAAX prenyl protease-related protein [Candidatus Tectimicrobiota bacterium]|nr:MAG: CAAX prenyl protease-related protein [Candidatus Tectomicrobia bacterium]
MAFLALEELLAWLGGEQAVWPRERLSLWLYPVKTAAVLLALAGFWRRYDELRGRPWQDGGEALLTLAVGVGVYVAWVRMDWPWAVQGQPAGYDPFRAGATAGTVLAAIRLFGAAAVVPVMEELFWRSFLLRYLVSARFATVALGTFTWPSFLITVVLFGLEHHYWLAGLLAGVAYTLLLYRTRRLWPCVLAHALTNLLLGVHVLLTGEWHWW